MEDYTITHKKKIHKPKTPTKQRIITDTTWSGIDLRNQGITNISPSLFDFKFIYELNLENNNIKSIPPEIKNLKNLEYLNLNDNCIKTLPIEISKLTNLRELYLCNNLISNVPVEFGSLCSIEILDLDNNPLVEPFASIYANKGGIGIINYCKENNSNYPPPMERFWIEFEEGKNEKRSVNEIFSVGSYNLLSEIHATEKFFGYVPLWVLKWENRREILIDEISKFSFDIFCAQEVVTQSFISFFRDTLNLKLGYDSLFYPKAKAKSMMTNFNIVDGCATFWKKQKYSLMEHKCIEFTKTILSDKRFNENVDIINRNMSKDNIALITVLRSKENLLIVVNVHLAWDPEFKDVKLMQTIILIEEIVKFKVKHPNAGIIFAGDINSLYDSGVYEILTKGRIESQISDFGLFNYHPYSSYGFSHGLNFTDSYKTKNKNFEEKDSFFGEEEDCILKFTNYTANFKEVIDYLFFNEKLNCVGVVSGIEESYTEKVVGFPTMHCGSDHILIGGKYSFKMKK